MTKSVSRIYQILCQIGIYDLTAESNITAELEAYNEGFKFLEEKLDKIKASIFPQTSEGESLQKHETLVGLHPRFSSSLQKRREIVTHRLSITPRHFTPESISKSVFAAGIRGHVFEFLHKEMISVVIEDIIDPTLTMEQIQQSLESLMPAHLSWSFDYGSLTFDLLDAKDVDWNVWDIEDFTWNEFDQNGENLFT